jgi:osmotically-inducible protein OsmY
MNRNWKGPAVVLLLAGLLATAPALGLAKQSNANSPTRTYSQLEKQVRHELLVLPFYGVFDNLEFRVDGDHVELMGQVTKPTLRDDAENVVKRIEGVRSVTNNIRVLPLSLFDDRIRVEVYRAVFRQAGLFRDAMGANPSIHIIVENGKVTLTGVVASKMDSILAYHGARGVPGTFSVTNNLRIES